MFLIVFFRENMCIHIINEAEKIMIFSLRARSFVHLNYQYLLNKGLITIGSHTQSGIQLSVRYLATSLYDPVIFVPLVEKDTLMYVYTNTSSRAGCDKRSIFKRIYEYTLVNPSFSRPLCFCSTGQNLIYFQGSIWTNLRSLFLTVPFYSRVKNFSVFLWDESST